MIYDASSRVFLLYLYLISRLYNLPLCTDQYSPTHNKTNALDNNSLNLRYRTTLIPANTECPFSQQHNLTMSDVQAYTPRVTAEYLQQFSHKTVRILGKVTQLRGENATIDSNGPIQVHLNRVCFPFQARTSDLADGSDIFVSGSTSHHGSRRRDHWESPTGSLGSCSHVHGLWHRHWFVGFCFRFFLFAPFARPFPSDPNLLAAAKSQTRLNGICSPGSSHPRNTSSRVENPHAREPFANPLFFIIQTSAPTKQW